MRAGRAKNGAAATARPVPAASSKRTRRSDQAATASASPPPAVVDKSQHLEMVMEPGKTEDRMVSDMLVRGLVSNASATAKFVKPQYDDVSLTDLLASLKESGERVNRGVLSAMESMLAAQAVTLNAIFGELARRAAVNVGCYHATMELYLRLALKARWAVVLGAFSLSLASLAFAPVVWVLAGDRGPVFPVPRKYRARSADQTAHRRNGRAPAC